MATKFLSEVVKFIPILANQDLNAAATMPGDSINMKDGHHCTFAVLYSAIGGAANYIKIYSGATAGATTSALTFNYRWMSAATAAAGADTFAGNWATSANLSVAHATYDDFLLIIEVSAASMDVANGEEWLTFQFEDTDTGATGNASVIAVVQPRYAVQATMLA